MIICAYVCDIMLTTPWTKQLVTLLATFHALTHNSSYKYKSYSPDKYSYPNDDTHTRFLSVFESELKANNTKLKPSPERLQSDCDCDSAVEIDTGRS